MVVSYVRKVMEENFPAGADSVPFHSRWRHFEAGGVDRVKALLEGAWASVDPMERARRMLDLAVVRTRPEAVNSRHELQDCYPSLVAGRVAGERAAGRRRWQCMEVHRAVHGHHAQPLGGFGCTCAGCGVATPFRRPCDCLCHPAHPAQVASFHMFLAGAFSSNPANPHQVDAEGLRRLTSDQIRVGFQVTDANPLVGVEGRTALLQRLGDSILAAPQFFAFADIDGFTRPGVCCVPPPTTTNTCGVC